MDLNLLYSQHQGSLMSAAATTSRLARTKHLAAAGMFANRIRNYQLAKGAAAAAGWLSVVHKGERGDLR
jgi:hypothetical protein